MKKRLLSKFLAMAIMLISVFTMTVTSEAATILPNSIYITQQYSNTCTLASATMMIRARLWLANDANWNVSESSVRRAGWAPGLYNSFSYSNGNNTVTLKAGYLSGSSSDRLASLKNLLDNHKDGVVMYCFQGDEKEHAVFLTDYEGDTLYCADPAGGKYSGKRIKVANSYLANYYGSQKNIVANACKYWMISKGPSVTVNVPSTLKISVASSDLPSGTIPKGKVYSIGGTIKSNYSMI